jgi:hypothetical protein
VIKRLGREADRSPLSRVEVKNASFPIFTPLHTFMVSCLINHFYVKENTPSLRYKYYDDDDGGDDCFLLNPNEQIKIRRVSKLLNVHVDKIFVFVCACAYSLAYICINYFRLMSSL